MPRTLAASAVVGRPRDPDVEHRTLDAAIAVYGQDGWSGFTIDAVARQAGVGKASIYRRWADKNELLAATLEAHLGRVADVDTGSLRGDLAALARQLLQLHLGVAGPAIRRLAGDAYATTTLSMRYQELQRSQIHAARRIVRRGVARGEIAHDTPVNLLLDCVVGAVANHVHATPPSKRPVLVRSSDAYARSLVDFLLR